MHLISRRTRLSSFSDMPTHNHTTDTYPTCPRTVNSAQCLLHIQNEAQCTGFKTEAHMRAHVDIEIVRGRDFTMLGGI